MRGAGITEWPEDELRCHTLAACLARRAAIVQGCAQTPPLRCYTAVLLLGGAAAVAFFTGMHIHAASLLIPIGGDLIHAGGWFEGHICCQSCSHCHRLGAACVVLCRHLQPRHGVGLTKGGTCGGSVGTTFRGKGMECGSRGGQDG